MLLGKWIRVAVKHVSFTGQRISVLVPPVGSALRFELDIILGHPFARIITYFEISFVKSCLILVLRSKKAYLSQYPRLKGPKVFACRLNRLETVTKVQYQYPWSGFGMTLKRAITFVLG